MPRFTLQQSRRRGFTLVELMISIAIVLLLVGGINLIFSTTSKAVGSGQALSEGARNNQAAQAVMYNDFSACATDDAPYIIISSHATPAFRTQADMQSDTLFDPATPDPAQILKVDLDNDNQIGVSPGEVISPTTYNDRNHRVDMVSFFARGLFKRQTGNPGTYVASGSSTEAMVWYGHLQIPNNGGTFSTPTTDTLPGGGKFGGNDNPNNYFATQWALGRQAILLNGSPDVPPTDLMRINQCYFSTAAGTDLSPLLANNVASYPATVNPSSPTPVEDDIHGFSALRFSRYDVCDTSIDLFRKRLNAVLDAGPNTQWWTFLMGGQNAYRFCCSPFFNKPISSAEFAKTAPIFLSGCSQFIVEYAGDFLTQSTPNSDVATAPVGPDGTIDFYRDATGKRQIRWYGLPRNTDSFAQDGITSETIVSGPIINAATGDVVPLRDVIAANGLVVPAAPDWFERTSAASDYLCAWGPRDTNRPQLIRITYSLDDPASRLGNPLTYEYVFKIK